MRSAANGTRLFRCCASLCCADTACGGRLAGSSEFSRGVLAVRYWQPSPLRAPARAFVNDALVEDAEQGSWCRQDRDTRSSLAAV
jgi:hypothetical protein